MTWFTELTGLDDESRSLVHEMLFVDDCRIESKANGQSWQFGHLETPTLGELRDRTQSIVNQSKSIEICEVVANVQQLHCEPENKGAMFQVASQFNLLEMTSPEVSPELGIGIYQFDLTQGPACAIAAGAGTIYRNYFVPIQNQLGQTEACQIDCLELIGKRLGNDNQSLWAMQNGYALPTRPGIKKVNEALKMLGEDEVGSLLRIGLQSDTEVTLTESRQLVSQAYCSAMPVAYSAIGSSDWEPFAKLVLDAAYEATFLAAIENRERTGNNRLYLTLLGGGAFGNQSAWIISSIQRSIALFSMSGLDVRLVSFRRPNPDLRSLLTR